MEIEVSVQYVLKDSRLCSELSAEVHQYSKVKITISIYTSNYESLFFLSVFSIKQISHVDHFLTNTLISHTVEVIAYLMGH